ADVDAPLHVLPTIWFRNTGSWGRGTTRPELQRIGNTPAVALTHEERGRYTLHFEGTPDLVFTENETNRKRIFGIDDGLSFSKDGINDYVVHGVKEAVNPARRGTKAAGHYQLIVGAGQSTVVRLRLTDGVITEGADGVGDDFD